MALITVRRQSQGSPPPRTAATSQRTAREALMTGHAVPSQIPAVWEVETVTETLTVRVASLAGQTTARTSGLKLSPHMTAVFDL